MMPSFSAFWITIPLALLMFGYLFYDRYFSSFSTQKISLLSLLELAKKKGWDFGPQSLHIVDFTRALRQAALDAIVILYGKRGNPNNLIGGEPLEQIPREHWKSFSINYGLLSQLKDNKETQTDNINEYGFSDLHLDKWQTLRWLRDKQTTARRGEAKPQSNTSSTL